ncbi:TPR_REGION domain-containing protein [Rubrivivax sp. A210]|uniref:S1 family peptidase n=1 Tax=Rubrivivax sp. A210 TaxID=2772301 RepID=UPI001918844A|nr:tetratricopeptide repeat-containing serine protease family protein [Rubrivivax sp. A210]CAD5372141.1 TPR_REGION domain-containing protein [Rubrivivax sp. A210]
MKFALLLLGALLGALPAGAAQAAPDRAAAIRLSASVLKIEVQRVQGGYALGSAVAVAPGVVVTNCHVTREALQISVVRGGQRWRVDAQASDAGHDLCALRVPGLQADSVVLGRSNELKPGQSVLALGYTGGVELQRSEGDIVALHRLDGAQVIQVRNGFNSGASGGGLFDDTMRLVGILTFRLRGGQAHYYAAPVEWLQPLIAADGDFRAVAPLAATAAAFWQVPAATQPVFLRAAALERERRWEELEALAFNWTRSDARDPQAWYLHGLALRGLQRPGEAQRALEQSLALDAGLQEAWFQLGMLNIEQGRLEPARQARDRLEALNPELAATLARVLVPQ